MFVSVGVWLSVYSPPCTRVLCGYDSACNLLTFSFHACHSPPPPITLPLSLSLPLKYFEFVRMIGSADMDDEEPVFTVSTSVAAPVQTQPLPPAAATAAEVPASGVGGTTAIAGLSLFRGVCVGGSLPCV